MDESIERINSTTPRSIARTRVLTNLAAVAEDGAADDFRLLAQLVAEQAPQPLAVVQCGIDAWRGNTGLPLTTAAIVAMSDRERIVELLVADGDLPAVAEALAEIIERQAWHLLVAGITPSTADPGTTPGVGTAETFEAARWRVLLAPLVTAPWSGRTGQLQQEVNRIGDPWLARLLDGCALVIRDLQAEWDRQAIAREIRRLVDTSGVTQRDYAALVGTSQSRFSTYITGRVTPSATMMLRISRTARTLRQQAAEPTAVRSAS